MTELGTIAEYAYDRNTYNLCRSTVLIQQDQMFIDNAFERMVENSVEYIPDLDYEPIILELGCGIGLPYSRHLSRYGRLMGCDISSNQVGCARLNVPNARFVKKDVMELHLGKKYDIVAMFNSFYNIDKVYKSLLLGRINYWLNPYGVVIITTHGDKTEVIHKDDFYGMPMTWHHISSSDFEKMVSQAGFSIVEHETRDDAVGSKDTHLWLLEKSLQ